MRGIESDFCGSTFTSLYDDTCYGGSSDYHEDEDTQEEINIEEERNVYRDFIIEYLIDKIL